MRVATRNQSLKRNLIACVILASLFHPFGLQSIYANNLDRQKSGVAVNPITIDLCEAKEGMLRGRLVSPRGLAVAGVKLTLNHEAEGLANATSGEDGRFALPAPSPGVYTITNGTWVQPLRIWAPGTAPPVAKSELLVITPETIVAGQVSPLRYWMANPNVMLATAAIAIGVPILIYRPATD